MSNQQPIHVGVLFSNTGVTAPIERTQLSGTLFAIHEVNAAGGINGRELVPVLYDPQSDAVQYASLAERLILNDDVNVIFGCYMSSTRKAVLPIVEKWNRLLFYPTIYEGFEFSNNVIYTGAAPNQNSVQLADFMTLNFGSRVYLVGSNYIYPFESNRIMTDLVEQRNGKTVGKRYLPLTASYEEFTSVVSDIRKQQPDFIFSTVVGESTQHLYRAYAEAGLNPKEMPIASLTTCEAEIKAMGAEYAAGHYTAAPYFQSIDSDTNRRVLDLYRKFMGGEVVTNMCWEAAYFQVHMFANAMRQSGTDQVEALLPELLGAEFQAPQGRVRIDPATHHTCLYPRIGRANSKGQFTIVREAKRPVHPDPYLVTYSLGDWTTQIDTLDL
ncbi:transporter substrate-binding domain-containing protein [Sulfuritalea sp.]|uniref:transporter substrate-binding domain-containing protein n=1 Tax=Sulfuritalea sp. TaxID=2480090 RepID=UPI00286E913D|nr:transporter substrate-binding domain-containing protein [Sulfuritalea sp.]